MEARWEMYLAKYITKAEPAFRIQPDAWAEMNKVQRYLTARVISQCKADTVFLGFDICWSSHTVQFLPTSIHNRRFVLKQARYLPTDDKSIDIYCHDA